MQEQELYQKEGLGVNEVRYVDNQDCIGKCVSLPSNTLFIFKVCSLKKKKIKFSKVPYFPAKMISIEKKYIAFYK